jgi:hypothetical protein
MPENKGLNRGGSLGQEGEIPPEGGSLESAIDRDMDLERGNQRNQQGQGKPDQRNQQQGQGKPDQRNQQQGQGKPDQRDQQQKQRGAFEQQEPNREDKQKIQPTRPPVD